MDRRHGIRVALALTPVCLATIPWTVLAPLAYVAVRRGVAAPSRTGLAPIGLTVVTAAGLTTLVHASDPRVWLGFASFMAMVCALLAWSWLARDGDERPLALGALVVLVLEAGWSLVEVVWLGHVRAMGTTFHPNVLGAVTVACGLLLMGVATQRASTRRPRRTALHYTWITLLMAVPLVLSGSRAAMASALIGVAVLVGLRSLRSRPWRVGRIGIVLMAVVAIVVPMLMFVGSPPELRGRWGALDGTLDPVGRPAIWGVAAEIVVQRPLLGHGFDAWPRLAPTIDPALRTDRMVNAHNSYLELAIDGGMLLLLAVLAGLVATFRVLIRRADAGLPVAATAASVLAAFLVHNGAESFVHQAHLMAFVWLPVGLALSVRNRSDDGPPGSEGGRSAIEACDVDPVPSGSRAHRT